MCSHDSESNPSPIRSLQERDSDRVAQIWLEGSKDAHAFKPPGFWEGRFDKMEGIFRKADGWVYEIDGMVVGFIVVRLYGGGGTAGGIGAWWQGTATNVDDLFVLGAHREKGIGKALMQRAQREHKVLTLNVYVKNNCAVEWYRQRGFSQIGEPYLEDETQEYKLWMRWIDQRTK